MREIIFEDEKTGIDWTKVSLRALVKRFTEIAIAMDDTFPFDLPGYNKLSPQIKEIRDEVRDRGLDARRAFLPLLEHPNEMVQLEVAWLTYTIAPERTAAVISSACGRRPAAHRLECKEFPQERRGKPPIL